MDFKVTLVRADGSAIDGAWFYSAPQLPAVDDQILVEDSMGIDLDSPRGARVTKVEPEGPSPVFATEIP